MLWDLHAVGTQNLDGNGKFCSYLVLLSPPGRGTGGTFSPLEGCGEVSALRASLTCSESPHVPAGG